MPNEKINYKVEEHTDDLIAQRFGPGWYHVFDDADDVKSGPFPTHEAASEAAMKAIEEAIAEATVASLFGEAA